MPVLTFTNLDPELPFLPTFFLMSTVKLSLNIWAHQDISNLSDTSARAEGGEAEMKEFNSQRG